jgi:hypothetical protein
MWTSSKRKARTDAAADVLIAAKADVAPSLPRGNVKRAQASGRSHNVDVIKKEGED